MPYTPFRSSYRTDAPDDNPFASTPASNQFRKRDWQPGWYVILTHRNRIYLAPMRFARQRDADMAAAALNRLHQWSQDTNTLRRQIATLGWERLRKAMLESLQW